MLFFLNHFFDLMAVVNCYFAEEDLLTQWCVSHGSLEIPYLMQQCCSVALQLYTLNSIHLKYILQSMISTFTQPNVISTL